MAMKYIACMATNEDYAYASMHGYRYSIGIGDDWSVKYHDGHSWRGCGPYEYGCGIAHYPVPAIILDSPTHPDYYLNQCWAAYWNTL